MKNEDDDIFAVPISDIEEIQSFKKAYSSEEKQGVSLIPDSVESSLEEKEPIEKVSMKKEELIEKIEEEKDSEEKEANELELLRK